MNKVCYGINFKVLPDYKLQSTVTSSDSLLDVAVVVVVVVLKDITLRVLYAIMYGYGTMQLVGLIIGVDIVVLLVVTSTVRLNFRIVLGGLNDCIIVNTDLWLLMSFNVLSWR